MTMANVKIQYTEDMVGQNHATKSDTLNRLVVGINDFRLIKSGANLTLQAVGGNLVDIDGNIMAVTVLPTLGTGGLTANILYYVYLFNSGGTATLEAVTGGYTIDSKGRANKINAADHRLMGMALPIAGPAWSDTESQRYVVSYDHRRSLKGFVVTGGTRTSGAGAWTELNSAERVGFLAWGDESLWMALLGSAWNGTASVNTFTAGGLDGTTPATGNLTTQQPVGGGGQPLPAALSALITPTVGYHYTTVLGYVSSGTGSWAINTYLDVQG